MSSPSDLSGSRSPTDGSVPDTQSGADEGIAFALLERFPLSASLRGVLASAQQTARNEQFRGLIGTGMMLICLERAGNRVVASGEIYAPNVLRQLLDRLSNGRFAAARQRFFDRNRRSQQDPIQTGAAASRSLQGVFERAMQLPRHDGILAARHLITSLLVYQPPGRSQPTSAWEILRDAGVDRDRLAAEFIASLAEAGPAAERSAWKELSASYLAPGKGEQLAGNKQVSNPGSRGPYIPGYGSDNPSGRASDDCLNLDSTVQALAQLIVSPQLDGNLSLGVFGNWGSGKSFFMRRLRGAISDLATQARLQSKQRPTQAASHWPNIVQVEFNAWHYIDANLWASLMSHLLSDLRRWEPEVPVSASASTPLRQALDRLSIATEMRDEAVLRERQARDAKDSAEALLQNTRLQQDAAVHELSLLASRSLWSFIEEREGFVAIRRKLLPQLKQLGLDTEEATGSLETIYGQLQELGTVAGTMQTVGRSLLKAPGTHRQLTMILLIVLLPLVLLLLLSFSPARELFRETGVWLGTSMVSVIAAGLQGVRWIHGQANRALELLAPLGAARRTIESGLAAASSEKARLISLGEQKVAAAQASVAAAQAGLAEKEKELRGAISEVHDAISGRAITRFIENRLASGDYQRHLGLIALIRRDFEQLSELVRAHNAQRQGLDQEVFKVREALRKARPDLSAAETEAFFAHLGINRIVLYIDDLDRCPSNRVVEVLQAIHLLLSFDVFVVVVGVDSRWMAHSLAKEFSALLARTKEDQDKDRVWSREIGNSPVTPSDYLEKIFQIPLWVPPLNAGAAKTLIGKLAGSGTVGSPAPRDAQRAANHENTAISNAGDPPHPAEAPGAALLESFEANAERNTVDTRILPAQEQGAGTQGDPSTPVLPPVPLTLSNSERTAMQSLALVIGRSPRATKRFINSYRLFRAALTEAERSELGDLGDGLEGLAAPMLLLAVVTGAPVVAGRLLIGLSDSATGTVLQEVQSLLGLNDLDGLAPDTVRRLREFLMSEDAARWKSVTLVRAERWASRIAQFSFEDLSRREQPKTTLSSGLASGSLDSSLDSRLPAFHGRSSLTPEMGGHSPII